jgi:hypothetical protein
MDDGPFGLFGEPFIMPPAQIVINNNQSIRLDEYYTHKTDFGRPEFPHLL